MASAESSDSDSVASSGDKTNYFSANELSDLFSADAVSQDSEISTLADALTDHLQRLNRLSRSSADAADPPTRQVSYGKDLDSGNVSDLGSSDPDLGSLEDPELGPADPVIQLIEQFERQGRRPSSPHSFDSTDMAVVLAVSPPASP